MKRRSVWDIPMCNRGPDMKENLERILSAQLLLCEWEGTDPDDEPSIIELKNIINALSKV